MTNSLYRGFGVTNTGRCEYCFENTPPFIISPLYDLHGAKITECVSLPYLVARLRGHA
jgi:hypothetical protein